MLYVSLLKQKTGTPQKDLARRVQWRYPEGLRPIAEYWLQTTNPTVIAIYEADSVMPIMVANADWADVFDITVVPAITAEDGLRLAQHTLKLG